MMPRTADLLTTALGYARRGWLVFPLHSMANGRCSCGREECASPAKHPRTAHGLKDATRDETTICAWWQACATANIGVCTGRGSGIVVLDIDPRHGGDESLAQLEHRQGKFPDTVESITGGGGRHIFFTYPGETHRIRNATALAGMSGLDVRGDGGYVVAPPSLHISGGRYEWEASSELGEVPMAPIPAWLLKLLGQTKAGRGQPQQLDDRRAWIAQGVSEGGRNSSIASLTGLLLRHRVDPIVALHLVAAWNEARCRPPLSEAELFRTVDSIAGNELRRRHRGKRP